MKIIGRQAEIKELERLYGNGHSEFVVLYGRRRVGKTFLVNELFRDRITFSHTALSPIEIQGNELMKMKLQNLTHSLLRCGAEISSLPTNWLEAFLCWRNFLNPRLMAIGCSSLWTNCPGLTLRDPGS